MATDESQFASTVAASDLLQILRYELNFLEQGGYHSEKGGSPTKAPFTTSLTCLNFGNLSHPHACRECPLFCFVPESMRTEDNPCHHIPLEDGHTIKSLLDQGDEKYLRAALANWLRAEIDKLESQSDDQSLPI